jgi:hypothetical protein
MGYNTDYSLSIEPYDEDIHNHLIESVNDGYDPFEEGCKWYEWEEEMRKFSTLHPEHLFHITGFGVENDDIWAATFKNGKAHIRQAEIKIPPFDESLLE